VYVQAQIRLDLHNLISGTARRSCSLLMPFDQDDNKHPEHATYVSLVHEYLLLCMSACMHVLQGVQGCYLQPCSPKTNLVVVQQ